MPSIPIADLPTTAPRPRHGADPCPNPRCCFVADDAEGWQPERAA